MREHDRGSHGVKSDAMQLQSLAQTAMATAILHRPRQRLRRSVVNEAGVNDHLVQDEAVNVRKSFIDVLLRRRNKIDSPEIFQRLPSDEVAVQAEEAWLKSMAVDTDVNTIELGENIFLVGEIRGSNNVVKIADARQAQTVYLNIHGDGNQVIIGRRSFLQNPRIEIGSERWPSSCSRLAIGDGFSIGSGGRFLLPNSGNVIEIGNRCMFSASVQLRGGEYPHLIFSLETGAYLDVSDGIFVGDHAWIGEGAFIGKSVTIPSECIVGARSVVTRRFDEMNAVIAGNPAQIVKRGVRWSANVDTLAKDHPDLQESFASTNVARINREERKAGLVQPKIDLNRTE